MSRLVRLGDDGPDGIPSIPMTRPNVKTVTSTSGNMGLGGQRAAFYSDFASTPEGSRARASNNDESESKSMPYITTPVVLAPWTGGQHLRLFDGQQTFCVTSPSAHDGYQMPLLNLADMNDILREGYENVMALFDNSNGRMPIQGAFTDDELLQMSDLPVKCWKALEFVEEKMNNPRYSAINDLMYIMENMMVDRFNPFGWVHGQVTEEQQVQQVAIRRMGSIEDAQSVWPSTLQPGDNLYLILRRNHIHGKWGHFSFIPWFGPHEPSLSERRYMDFTGNEAFGCATHIGSVDCYVNNVPSDRTDLFEAAGITKARSMRGRTRAPEGCLRITAYTLGLPWLF